jgi:hypothetical protein
MELHDANPNKLLGHRGYDNDVRNNLEPRAPLSALSRRDHRKTPKDYDRDHYKRRNLIERCVNRLTQCRRIATRYEKTARAFLSMLCIAAAKLWIKTVNTGLVEINSRPANHLRIVKDAATFRYSASCSAAWQH